MAAGRRRGPKPQGPFEDKRRTLSTRITEETRSRLDDAARVSGRSLSQEIEFRLEQSFWVAQTFGDYRTQQLFREFALVAQKTTDRHENWMDDPELRRAVFRRWKRHLDLIHVTKIQTLYDKLTEQVRITAKDDLELARKLALVQCRTFFSTAAEGDRNRYYDEVQRITGLSSADLDREIDAAAAAEVEGTR